MGTKRKNEVPKGKKAKKQREVTEEIEVNHDGKTRCEWTASQSSSTCLETFKELIFVATPALMIKYHDEEWGDVAKDDAHLFEMFVLSGFQAGLNWLTILKKRAALRVAFSDYDLHKVAAYNAAKKQQLLSDENIIRNNAKISAAIHNAKIILQVNEEFGSFHEYISSFFPKGVIHLPLSQSTSKEGDAMSADMKKRGFKFAGPTICHAFLQSCGYINSHTKSCFKYRE